MSQLYFNSHFSDYKNQVQHNKTAIILLWKQLAKKWPLQDTIHCNIELRTQSKKPRARRKWGDRKKFTFPTVLPPRHFYKGKTKSKFLHCFLRKAYGVGNGGEGVLGFFIHQTLLNLFLLAITLSLSPSSCLQQQELQKKSTAPESNNPQGTCFAFLEVTSQREELPKSRSLIHQHFFFSTTARLLQKLEIHYIFPEVVSYTRINGKT